MATMNRSELLKLTEEERISFANTLEQRGETLDLIDDTQTVESTSFNVEQEVNQNPFNSQVHEMDIAGIEQARIQEKQPKTLMDKVKDFGSDALKSFTKPIKEVGLPIASVVEEATNSFLPDDLQTDIVPDLPSKVDDHVLGKDKNLKPVDSDTLDAIESLARTDISILGKSSQEDKDKYVNDLGKVVNLGGYNLVQTQSGEFKAQNKDGEILDLNSGFVDDMLRGIQADKYEIAGDIGAMALATKFASAAAKNPLTKTTPLGRGLSVVGTAALGGMIGNQIDTTVNSLKTGQFLGLVDTLNELSKAGILSLAGNTGGQVAGKAIGSTLDGAKYLKENGLPIGEKKLAQKYVDDTTNINSAENLESAEIAKELGAETTKLTQLASDGNAQKAMSDMFENSKEMREAVLADHDKLTNNLYVEGNINKFENNNAENVNDLMGGVIDEQVKGIDTVYKRVYGEVKDDIIEILGDSPLKVPGAKTANLVKDKIKMLDIGENAAGEAVGKSKNELDETYAGILDIAKSAFTDAEGEYINKFKISKMMDLNKQINQYAQLHKDKLTNEHFSVLREIRTAIDDDITNYATVTLDTKNAELVKTKWKEINGGYSEWLLGVGKDGNKIDNLLKDNMNIKTLATDMVGAGTIKNEYLETFGDIALHLRKTNPNALADLQDTVVNAILKPITVKQKFDGKTYEFIDFDMFEKMFDESTISTKGLNKIFKTSKDGAKKLDTLKAFRKLAKDEGALQKAIYKNESPLSEAGQKATEMKRSFLFGVKYFFTRTLVNAMASKFIPSVAFDKMVIDLASKQRYTLKDMDKTIRKIELSPEYKSFTPDEKVALKKLRTDAEANQKFIEEQAAKRKQEEDIQTEKELFEQLKKDADDRIKANMLLENKADEGYALSKDGDTIELPISDKKSPMPLDVQDRINVQNTKLPSTDPVLTKAQKEAKKLEEEHLVISDKDFIADDAAGKIPFSHPVVGGAAGGSGDAVVNERDYNNDGKVDEQDIALGAIIGAIGLKSAMKMFPQLFKIDAKTMIETGAAGAVVAGTLNHNSKEQ